jgi:hypothetical protein
LVPPVCSLLGLNRGKSLTERHLGGLGERVPRVRIPLPPPHSLARRENRLYLLQELLKIPVILQFSPSNGTGERAPSNPAGWFSGVFLWRAHAQSFSSDSVRRMQCDDRPMMRRKGLDFVIFWECPLSRPPATRTKKSGQRSRKISGSRYYRWQKSRVNPIRGLCIPTAKCSLPLDSARLGIEGSKLCLKPNQRVNAL